MASVVFKAFSDFNNDLCDRGSKGWWTLFKTPFIVGGLNIAIYVCILVTALLLRYAFTDNWQNTDGNGEKSFARSLLFSVIDWYFILLIIAFVYKMFLCKRTVGASRIYSNVQNFKRNF